MLLTPTREKLQLKWQSTAGINPGTREPGLPNDAAEKVKEIPPSTLEKGKMTISFDIWWPRVGGGSYRAVGVFASQTVGSACHDLPWPVLRATGGQGQWWREQYLSSLWACFHSSTLALSFAWAEHASLSREFACVPPPPKPTRSMWLFHHWLKHLQSP